MRLAKHSPARVKAGAWLFHFALLSLAPEFPSIGVENASPISPEQSELTMPPLSSAQQVLDLGLQGARHSVFPVRLQGLVTYPDPGANLIYVQDSSAGIRVIYTNADFQPAPGQLVIVEGHAEGGVFAPFVDCANVRPIGSAPIPEPCEAPAARMAAGELFGQWVQVEGVVRDVARESDSAWLFVSSGGLRFHAVIQPFPGSTLPIEWLDARLLLRGVSWTEVDAENTPTGFTLYVPGTNQVFVARQGAHGIFQQPTLPLNLQPELRRQSDARIKVAGVVAFHSLGGYVYLQDEGAAVRARLLVPLAHRSPVGKYLERPASISLRPGDRIEVVGAPTAAVFEPLLQDAEFRQIGQGTPPAPSLVSANDLFTGKFDGHLVTVKARLLASEARAAGALKHQVMALQSGDTLFEALFEFTGTNNFPTPPRNSYVEATGICTVLLGELNQIRSVRLLLRDPSEMRLLGKPPWWEPLPMGKIFAGSVTLVLVALIWIWLLRRQVAQRTAQLQSEIVERQRAQAGLHDALAAERELGELRNRFVSMVSHEFRTPLGVILSAAENIETYSDRLSSEQRNNQLQSVKQATRQMASVMENVLLIGRAEAGKMDFNPAPLDLVTFCQTLANQVHTSTNGKCPIEFHAGTFPPAHADEILLRHILTNLLSNAVKYSSPGAAVKLTLDRVNGEGIIRVQDKGIGIPAIDQRLLFNAFHRAGNATHLAGTGLGLTIVKRCVDLHGGQITCESTEGHGAVFTVHLPLFNCQAA
jgi:signal transduction histidine kinase